MSSLTILVSNPEALIVAVTPFETDQTPPEIGCVYCAVLLAQILAAPVIERLADIPATKLELVPVLSELVIVPLLALLAKLTIVVTDVLLPSAIPWLNL